MKFTKPNEDGILCNKIFDTHREAVEHFGSGVMPVVGLEEWSRMPKDYKGKKDGKNYCLYLTDKGTTYGEVNVVFSI